MKNFKFLKIVVVALSLLGAGLLSNCGGGGGDPGPAAESEQTRVTNLLKGTWNINNVTVDNVAHGELYDGLSITFTATGYTASNGGAVWPSSGTWTFDSSDAKSFHRNDATVVTIESISASALVLSLNWSTTTLGGGRTEALAGKNTFTFGK